MPRYAATTTPQSSAKFLAILGFHKIGVPSPDAWETWYYIPEATFVDYLTCLRDNGWQVIDHATVLQGLSTPEHLPKRAALITFDDGYRSVLEVALPWLRRFGYPAVLFVPTDFIGTRNWFDEGAEPEEDICDWNDLRQLERWSVSVQSHSVSHRWFSKLTVAERAIELRRSKQVLEAELAKPVEIFSFPYGDDGRDPQVTASLLKQAGYRAACLYGGGPHRLPITEAYRLARIALGPDTDLLAALNQE